MAISANLGRDTDHNSTKLVCSHPLSNPFFHRKLGSGGSTPILERILGFRVENRRIVASIQVTVSDLKTTWWETSDLKKNAWKLWSDSCVCVYVCVCVWFLSACVSMSACVSVPASWSVFVCFYVHGCVCVCVSVCLCVYLPSSACFNPKTLGMPRHVIPPGK